MDILKLNNDKKINRVPPILYLSFVPTFFGVLDSFNLNGLIHIFVRMYQSIFCIVSKYRTRRMQLLDLLSMQILH